MVLVAEAEVVVAGMGIAGVSEWVLDPVLVHIGIGLLMFGPSGRWGALVS